MYFFFDLNGPQSLYVNLKCILGMNLIIDIKFLIPAVILQFFNPTTEPALPIGISNKEAKTGIETHPVDAVSKCSI